MRLVKLIEVPTIFRKKIALQRDIKSRIYTCKTVVM